MRFTLCALGLTLIDVELTQHDDGEHETDDGSVTTYPLGFVASPGDQRWAEIEAPDYGGDE